ncbi:Aste57867_8350 [Aphanomyces stellatus]|uniref:Aste57867_8350 protein n=1 Tax=Aphanomyces stellatus TaxID=120398 RepID=A0A485KK67_9STRA|nr:hypothetical protein As57867_008318 [Aphanomyces stellatus]VFT85236.1 Aste57867_8350 [Aphanomyces stellatus]
MARIEAYRCPITIRTTSIQPYDLPRFVSDIIGQLHEISHWTTRCCTSINHSSPSTGQSVISSTVVPKDARVPTTILTEMDLIKRNLTVVEKQQNTRLLSEIAYLQCALRSEAEEKMTDFERYVEAKISQSVDENTKQLKQQQLETALAVSNMQDACRGIQVEMHNLTQRLNKMHTMLETTASRTVETMAELQGQFIESTKMREKNEATLGNHMSQTRMHLQEANASVKATFDQLQARVDIIRNEVKYTIDQLKAQMQQHAKAMNRFARGSNLFEMMTTHTESLSPNKSSKETSSRPTSAPRSRRPVSARPTTSQPSHVQPPSQSTNFVFANGVVPSTDAPMFDVQGKVYELINPDLSLRDMLDDEIIDDEISNNDGGLDVGSSILKNSHPAKPGIEIPIGGRDVPACYVMDQFRCPNAETPTQVPQLSIQTSKIGGARPMDEPLSGDRLIQSKISSPATDNWKRKKGQIVQETEEALEARLTASYDKALRSHGIPEAAISIYNDVLEFTDSLGSSPSITTKKIIYLCLKNLACLEANYDPPFFEEAMEHYAEALEIDGTDCIVWYDIGCISYRLERFCLARMLFEKSFNIDATFWPAVHKLAHTLYILNGKLSLTLQSLTLT